MYDVIIIGAGPAGISASLYTVRRNLKTLIIYQEKTALKKANDIENYYGFENGINGEKLYKIGIKQAKNIGAELVKDEVTNIKIEYKKDTEEQKKSDANKKIFKIQTLNKEFTAKTVILATGNKKRIPKINNIEKYEGKGISYCAICDGFFYKNKEVAVIGEGDYAVSEAMNLQHIAKTVTILTNGKQSLENRLKNINVIEKEIVELRGKDRVEEIEFKDYSKIKIDGVFIAQGIAGSTDFAKKLGAKIIDENKIWVDENMQTSIKGLFACGDCTGGLYQISKAVYEGTKAGLNVYRDCL